MMTTIFKKILQNERLLIGISELSEMSGVSTRQLRYWEQKDFIKSVSKEGTSPRKYRLTVVVKVEMIKKYLDDGFKLSRAVEKAEEKIQLLRHIRRAYSSMLKNVDVLEDRYTIFEYTAVDDQQQSLYVIHDEQTDTSHYHFFSTDHPITLVEIEALFKSRA